MITLTDTCVRQLLLLKKQKETPDIMLRITVDSGGCQGFEYRLDFVTTTTQDDHIIEKNGAKVVVDAVSLPFMQGAEIDYVDDLIGAQFKIHNPNAKSSCGCGTSFSL